MSAPAHLRHEGWVIEPDYSCPSVAHTWVASSSDYEISVAAATYGELLDEIAAVEADFAEAEQEFVL
jgi:hypothetical protein